MSKKKSASIATLRRDVATSIKNADCSSGEQTLPGITCGLVFYLILGLEETIMVSYYSLEAQKRGLNTLETGLGFAAMEISNFLASFILMYFIKESSMKTICVFGVLILAAASSAMGALQWVQSGRNFVLTSVIIESCKGIGVAMSLATILPLITVLSLGNAGKMTSSADALLNLGCMIGPPLGSVLFHYFGFFVPSIVVGSPLFLCAVFIYFMLPEKKLTEKSQQMSIINDPKLDLQLSTFSVEQVKFEYSHYDDSSCKFDPWAYFKFTLNPLSIILSSPAVIIAAQIIFFEVCLPLFLQRVFGFSVIKIGFTCSAISISIVCFTLIYGVFVDKGYAVHVTILTSLGFSLSFFLLYLPSIFPFYLESVWFMTTCFILVGCFAAGANVPSFLVLEKFALATGFSNLSQVKLLVATRCSNSIAIGEVLGTVVISGVLYDIFGFYGSCLTVSCTMALSLMVTVWVLHRMKLMGKLYYEDVISSKNPQQNDDFLRNGSSSGMLSMDNHNDIVDTKA